MEEYSDDGYNEEMTTETSVDTSEDSSDDSWKNYGNNGEDPYASYSESHFSETDDRYMDEEAEQTEASNLRVQRELEEFDWLQNGENEAGEAVAVEQHEAEEEAERQLETEETEFWKAEGERLEALKAEEETEQNEYDKQLKDMNDSYKNLDNEYGNRKNDIEMSRSKEEQDYWTRRADTIWNERDKLGADIEDFKSSQNK